MIEDCLGHPIDYSYDPVNRVGDHICYISDIRRLEQDYPEWGITHPLESILDVMLEAELERETLNQHV